MALIRLVLPEDFDKRYRKYRERFAPKEKSEGMPEPYLVDSFESEKKSFLLIKNEADYQHEIDKWTPLKTIVDEIYRSLSPFTERNQSIEVSLTKLRLPEKVVSPIMLSLVYERLCKWQSTSPGIVSNVPVIEYLQGKIVVPSYAKFKQFRQKVHEFCEFMGRTKSEKFPKPSRPTLDILVEMQKEAKSSLEKHVGEYNKAVVTATSLLNANKSESITLLPSSSIRQPATKSEDGGVPLIEYNEVTGKGVVGTKKFTLKDGKPDNLVFKQLYNRIGKKMERQDVLIAGGFYEDHEDPDPARKTDETAFINDIAKSLREKTNLNTEQLVNNNGCLTLLAEKKVPPKKTKLTPDSTK